MRWRRSLLAALAILVSTGTAHATAVQIDAGNTSLLFGGIDAEAGIGDWYLSNGVVEAMIDDVGPAPDLVGVLPPAEVPPIQSEIAFTGGNLLDVGRVGANSDQLTQMFTVGGLSTANFLLYDTITTPNANTIRATGGLLFPPISVQPSPCLDVVTDYGAGGTDPFLTITSTVTNNCGVAVTGLGGLLDVFIWTLRSIVPFSAGGLAPLGGKGFNHNPLDLANPAAALEVPTFMAGPGALEPADGIVDPADGTTCGEVSYGLLGVELQIDADGPGGSAPTITPVNSLFGVSSNLVSALGNAPAAPAGGILPGGTLAYTRRLYVGTRNDVRTVGDGIITELAGRVPFSTGTISGNVDAADTPDVEASIVVTRVGECQANPATPCKANADCGANGPCGDPVVTSGQGVGVALSQIRTDATGGFGGVVLPRGDYELRVSAVERDDVVVSPITVGAGNTAVVIPPLGARGTLAFSVRERRSGMPLIPAKLTFKGVSPTPDPSFNKDVTALLGTIPLEVESFGGAQPGTSGHAAGQLNVVFTATGEGQIQLRPGTYDVYASRGMEYTVALEQVTVPSGGITSVALRLKRAVRTRNALSGDFHVHSGRSLDTHAALRDRVAAFAGEGVEVMISTDHDKNVDYGSYIASFGLGSLLTSIIGNELTGSVPNPPAFPQSIGHINAWPLTVSPNQPRDGAVADEYVAPNWDYKRLRDGGAEVIQYNHPRAGVSGLTTIGIFNNIGCTRCANDIDMPCSQDTDCPVAPLPRDCTCVGYQPDRPITMAPNDILLDDGIRGPGTTPNTDGLDNLDFDVMEVANGAKVGDFPSLRLVRRDWWSLLNQGIVKPGTGVSDSHRITVEHAGWARTYVFGVGDDPALLDVTAFDDQVKAGNMVIAAGPFIEFSARGAGRASAGLGQLLAAPDGKVRLKIKVRAPAWIPVEEVRIIGNGFQVIAFDGSTRPRVKNPPPEKFQRAGRTSRFRANVRLQVSQDTYFIVEAGAKLPPDIDTPPTSPPIVSIVEPEVVPFAITNPIFVDTNGNALFDPPGLPVTTMAERPDAERPPFAHVRLAPRGLWDRLREGVRRLASRVSGEVVAQEKPRGEMTGITKKQKAEASKKGEYFPLYEFSIPTETADDVLRAEEGRRKATERGAATPAEGR